MNPSASSFGLDGFVEASSCRRKRPAEVGPPVFASQATIQGDQKRYGRDRGAHGSRGQRQES